MSADRATDRSTDGTGVLLVEDDQNIVDLVRSNLMARGHHVSVSKDGSDAVALLEQHEPEMVILDLMLPGVDGFDLCREMRERSSVGIVVLSARRAETDKVRALNLGADDYMTKPFGVDELLARIHATLRRSRPLPTEPEHPAVVAVRDLVVDLEARRVTKGGVLVHLTPTELALLQEFVLNPGTLLSHAALLRRVWGRGYETQTEYTRVYVARLRSKLEDPGGPPLFITEPRSGYRFTTE